MSPDPAKGPAAAPPTAARVLSIDALRLPFPLRSHPMGGEKVRVR
jgi:hypothetical protein